MKYKITVFTPTYNRADKLHRVYDSIKAQTLQKVDDKYIFEWIIVDDGSDDGTKELVQKWQDESEFEIRYFYQKNQGKPSASRKAIKEAEGELFLFADSDDAFLSETFETFYNVWNSFNDEEKEKCGSIGVLHNDQYGNPLGNDYPIENKLLPTIDTVFKWRDIGLGDTWAVLKTKNLKYAFLNIPDEAKKLKFIPETFFWDRIVFELKPYSYYLNKRLGIVYRNENNADNISVNIRGKYPEGFLFESYWFINNYRFVFFKDSKVFLKHLLKCMMFSRKLKKECFWEIDNVSKILYMLLLMPSFLISKKYFKDI